MRLMLPKRRIFFSAADIKTTTTVDGKDVVTRVAPQKMKLDLDIARIQS
jgi:hypothetical protein